MNKGLSKSAWNTLKENIETYLVTTTIHGFRYLYEGRDWAERICWAVVLGLSFSAAVYTISHSFDEAAKEFGQSGLRVAYVHAPMWDNQGKHVDRFNIVVDSKQE